MNNLIHLSIFPNSNCIVCGKEVKSNALHCVGCLDEWIKSKILETNK